VRIRFAQDARHEFSDATRWYAKEAGAAQARAFRNEILRVIRLLAEHPDMGTPGARGYRRMTTHRFPYDVVYRHEADALRIIAIAHQSRRPGYWAERR
jgi:plasmid stabilization system protein ParE